MSPSCLHAYTNTALRAAGETLRWSTGGHGRGVGTLVATQGLLLYFHQPLSWPSYRHFEDFTNPGRDSCCQVASQGQLQYHHTVRVGGRDHGTWCLRGWAVIVRAPSWLRMVALYWIPDCLKESRGTWPLQSHPELGSALAGLCCLGLN